MRNQNGFSLVQVMMAAGLMGAMSLGVLQMTKSMKNSQIGAVSNLEIAELSSFMRMILDKEKFCKVSLKDKKFKKRNIDDLDGNGLDIAFYYSNSDGTARADKLVNGADNKGSEDKSNFGGIVVESLELFTPYPSNNKNYPKSSSHDELGVVKLKIGKRVSLKTTTLVSKEFPVRLFLKTSSTGTSTIVSCYREPDFVPKVRAEKRTLKAKITRRDYSGDDESCSIEIDIGGRCKVKADSRDWYGDEPDHWDDTKCYDWFHKGIIEGTWRIHSQERHIKCARNEKILYGKRKSKTTNETIFLIVDEKQL